MNAKCGKWIKDRNPTPEEVAEAGDTGFILCISGKDSVWDSVTYDHAIILRENFFEKGSWYIEGMKDEALTVHGWMMPPGWEETG